MEKELSELEITLHNQRTKKIDLEKVIRGLEGKKKHLEDDILNLDERIRKSCNDLEALNLKVAVLRKEVKESSNALIANLSQVEEEKKKVEAIRQLNAATKKKIEEQQTTLDSNIIDFKNKLAIFDRIKTQFDKDKIQLGKDNAAQIVKLENLSLQKSDLEKEKIKVREAQSKLDSALKEENKLHNQLHTGIEENKILTALLSEQQKALKQKEQDLDARQERVNGQILKLGEQKRELENKEVSLKRNLSDLKNFEKELEIRQLKINKIIHDKGLDIELTELKK